MSGAQTTAPVPADLLELVDTLLVNVRHGADSRVVLYAWRKAGGDDASFQQAVAALLSAGLVALVDRPDRPRLTRAGFEALREQLEQEEAEATDEESDESEWQRPVSSSRPMDERIAVLIEILSVLRPPVDHPVSATSLRRLWLMEGMRAGDLRDALDALAQRGTVRLDRHDQGTDILLTPQGAAELPGAT